MSSRIAGRRFCWGRPGEKPGSFRAEAPSADLVSAGDLPPKVVRAREDVAWLRRSARGYFVIAPQAIRSPELPAGSDFLSPGLAWITKAVPPLGNRDRPSTPKFTRGSFSISFAMP